MRALTVSFLLLALAGCQDRRSFDQRYADTESNINERAQRLDAELNKADEASSDEGQPPNR